MLTLTDAIRARLVQDEAVCDAFEERLYPLVPPKDVHGTYGLMQVITDTAPQLLEGTLSLRRVRWQFSAWSKHYRKSQHAARAVRDVLQDYSGPLSDDFYVSGIACETYGDVYDDVAQLYGVQADYIVQVSETQTDAVGECNA